MGLRCTLLLSDLLHVVNIFTYLLESEERQKVHFPPLPFSVFALKWLLIRCFKSNSMNIFIMNYFEVWCCRKFDDRNIKHLVYSWSMVLFLSYPVKPLKVSNIICTVISLFRHEVAKFSKPATQVAVSPVLVSPGCAHLPWTPWPTSDFYFHFPNNL